MGARKAARPRAFINVPYHPSYEPVYLAFIAGVSGYGLVPSAAVHDPSSNYQLERIYGLIARSRFSFHDLSWMSLDEQSQLPRLNMTFELGLAVAVSRMPRSNHQWFVFDTERYRLQKALSDLGGVQPRIHNRTPESVLRALMNALARQRQQPTLDDLLEIYQKVDEVAQRIKQTYAGDLFDSRPLNDLTFVANLTANRLLAND